MQIRCMVKPNSRTDDIVVVAEGFLRVKIKATPIDGKANKYLIKYLSDVFELPKNHIQIISGFTGSHKRVNIIAEEQKIKSVFKTLTLKA